MSRSLRVLKCADPEPTMIFTGASTFATGLVLLANPTLFLKYPQTFGLLATAAPQWVWGIILLGIGVSKWCTVERENHRLAFGTTIIGMVLWWSITMAILLLGQWILLVAFTGVSGAMNCWLCVQIGKQRDHERSHGPTIRNTIRDDSGVDNGVVRDEGDPKSVRQRRSHRVPSRPYARQRSSLRETQRVRGQA